VLRAEPSIDFLTAAEADLHGLPDPKVLEIAADEDRVLVTHDRKTMPYHFADFLAKRLSPGLIIIPQELGVGVAVFELLLSGALRQRRNGRECLLRSPGQRLKAKS
jgi:hypothetical protein